MENLSSKGSDEEPCYPRLDRTLGEATAAIRESRRVLLRLEKAITAARADYRVGHKFSEWPAGKAVDAWFDLQDVLLDLQRSLGDTRKEVFRTAYVEAGMSYSEIAAASGRTRQVVTRLVQAGEQAALEDDR